MPRRLLTHYGTTLTTIAAAAAMVTAVAVLNHQADERIRDGQVEACERGNVIRLQMAEDNAIAIATARTQLTAPAGLTDEEVEALRSSITRRTARNAALAPYPCHNLR